MNLYFLIFFCFVFISFRGYDAGDSNPDSGPQAGVEESKSQADNKDTTTLTAKTHIFQLFFSTLILQLEKYEHNGWSQQFVHEIRKTDSSIKTIINSIKNNGDNTNIFWMEAAQNLMPEFTIDINNYESGFKNDMLPVLKRNIESLIKEIKTEMKEDFFSALQYLVDTLMVHFKPVYRGISLQNKDFSKLLSEICRLYIASKQKKESNLKKWSKNFIRLFLTVFSRHYDFENFDVKEAENEKTETFHFLIAESTLIYHAANYIKTQLRSLTSDSSKDFSFAEAKEVLLLEKPLDSILVMFSDCSKKNKKPIYAFCSEEVKVTVKVLDQLLNALKNYEFLNEEMRKELGIFYKNLTTLFYAEPTGEQFPKIGMQIEQRLVFFLASLKGKINLYNDRKNDFKSSVAEMFSLILKKFDDSVKAVSLKTKNYENLFSLASRSYAQSLSKLSYEDPNNLKTHLDMEIGFLSKLVLSYYDNKPGGKVISFRTLDSPALFYAAHTLQNIYVETKVSKVTQILDKPIKFAKNLFSKCIAKEDQIQCLYHIIIALRYTKLHIQAFSPAENKKPKFQDTLWGFLKKEFSNLEYITSKFFSPDSEEITLSQDEFVLCLRTVYVTNEILDAMIRLKKSTEIKNERKKAVSNFNKILQKMSKSRQHDDSYNLKKYEEAFEETCRIYVFSQIMCASNPEKNICHEIERKLFLHIGSSYFVEAIKNQTVKMDQKHIDLLNYFIPVFGEQKSISFDDNVQKAFSLHFLRLTKQKQSSNSFLNEYFQVLNDRSLMDSFDLSSEFALSDFHLKMGFTFLESLLEDYLVQEGFRRLNSESKKYKKNIASNVLKDLLSILKKLILDFSKNTYPKDKASFFRNIDLVRVMSTVNSFFDVVLNKVLRK